MLTYEELKNQLIVCLLRDSRLHTSGHHREIGGNFGEFDANLPRTDDPRFTKLHIAFNFWANWQDAAEHDWHFYEGISESDWPDLAGIIITNLRDDDEITNALILKDCDIRPRNGLFKRIVSSFKPGADQGF